MESRVWFTVTCTHSDTIRVYIHVYVYSKLMLVRLLLHAVVATTVYYYSYTRTWRILNTSCSQHLRIYLAFCGYRFCYDLDGVS